MTEKEYLEFALGICEKEIEEDIYFTGTEMERFDKLSGIKRGLTIMYVIINTDWSEDSKLDYIKKLIEDF